MKKVMPPTYLYVFILLAVLLHFVFPIKRVISAPYTYLGVLVFIIGVWINIWAWKLFREKKTTLNPYKKSSKFEIKGPFKISRNPMYLGMFLNLVGLAVYLGTVITFIFPVLFFIIMQYVYIPVEEKSMKRLFGKKYIDYKNKVRRWI